MRNRLLAMSFVAVLSGGMVLSGATPALANHGECDPNDNPLGYTVCEAFYEVDTLPRELIEFVKQTICIVDPTRPFCN